MINCFKYSKLTRTLQVFFTFALFLGLTLPSYAGGEDAPEKISPSIKLSYKISNGTKSIKIVVSRKVEKKYVPVENLIVNLYFAVVKKYDPATGDGWVGNFVTDENGEGIMTLSEQFNKLKENTHTFNFIASIGSDPVYENTQEEITFSDSYIKLSSQPEDSLTSVTAALSKYTDSTLAPVPETDMKLFVKRTFGMLPFGEDNLSTDEKGEVSGLLPGDLPGNPDKTITVVARYEDQENDGIIETSMNIPWKILPRENKLNERTLWSSGSNAPVVLVVVTVSLIVLIWGTISYLVLLLFRIKKAR